MVFLESGHAVFTLMRSLAEHNDSLNASFIPHQLPVLEREEFASTYQFFFERMGQIEVLHHDRLVRVHFPVPPICKHLTKAKKREFNRGLNRDSAGTKIMGFCAESIN